MIRVLGTTFNPMTERELAAFLLVRRTEPIHVVTVNAEMLLAAHRDARLCAIIHRAGLCVVDSVAIQWIALLTGQTIPQRHPGVDVMSRWLSYAHTHEKSVFLIGADAPVLHALLRKVDSEYPGLIVQGISDISVNENGESTQTPAVRAAIEGFEPDFIFVALGHGKQEYWIARNIDCFPKHTVAMGVGGSFSLIAGIVKRAPCWMQKIGLEWLWRLLQEPWRFMRIVRAVIVFPLLALSYAIFNRNKNS